MIDANSRHTDANTTLTLSRVICYSLRKIIRGLQNGRTRLYGARCFDCRAVHSGRDGGRGRLLHLVFRGFEAAQVRAVNVGYGC